jgi:hypothetical protein
LACFEAQDTLGVVLVLQVKALLAKLKITNKIIACVKDERGHLTTLVIAITFVVSLCSIAN